MGRKWSGGGGEEARVENSKDENNKGESAKGEAKANRIATIRARASMTTIVALQAASNG
jgi:hypothetical protein